MTELEIPVEEIENKTAAEAAAPPVTLPRPETREIKWLAGVRAVSVFVVMIYHMFPRQWSGGFLGVDVFFAISGYLVTSRLMQAVASGGRYNYVSYIKKRFLRLFPPLLFMAAAVLSLSLLISPDFRVEIRRQAAAALSWTTNYFEIVSGGSYENRLLPNLFVHTWTLGVEMQFYLIWGAAAGFIALLARRAGGRGRVILRWLAAAGVLALTVFAWFNLTRLSHGVDDPSRAYYSSLSHSAPLLIGAFAALLTGGSEMPGALKRLAKTRAFPYAAYAVLIALACGAAALSFILSFSDAATYRYGIVAVAAATAAAIVLVRMLQETRELRDFAVFRWAGGRSYNIYLFHWPLYIIISRISALSSVDAYLVNAGSVAAALCAAEVSYRMVERRFRGGWKPERKGAFATAAVACVLAAAAFAAVYGAPKRTMIKSDYMRAATETDIFMLARINEGFISLPGRPIADGDHPLNGVAINSRGEDSLPPPPSIARFLGMTTVIGDSVTLGSSRAILDTIPNSTVDAEVSRNMSMGARIIADMRDEGLLGEFVVIALASNAGRTTNSAAEDIIAMMEPGHRLIFVTGHGRDFMEPANEFIRGLPERYPFVTVADWDAAVSEQPHLLAADGVHTHGAAATALYAQCIADAIETARERATT